MKLGYIDFLNCFPFYFHMFEKEPIEDVSIIPGYPGQLNKMLTDQELDMSPVSSATCADIQDNIFILPEFCLSSVGYVGSVTLACKAPIEDLNNKKIGVTNASHTSAVLLKILLKKYFNAEPVYIATGPRPLLDGLDAVLLIGNDALVKSSEPVPYIYDLGDMWMRKTGFPVVFALFAVRKDVADQYEDKINKVLSSYRKSLDSLAKSKEDVISKAREKYPDIIYDIDRYYNRLKFDFTHDLKRALMVYFSEAAEMGLIKSVSELIFLP